MIKKKWESQAQGENQVDCMNFYAASTYKHFFSFRHSIRFFPFAYLHSYDGSNRPSRIFQSCLSPATLSGSSLELPQRYLSPPASSGSTPGFSLCWLRLENLQTEALRRHPNPNPLQLAHSTPSSLQTSRSLTLFSTAENTPFPW